MSARPFLITGLPRSRTAWMAAFMSTGSVLCKHEPIKALYDISDLPATLESEYHSHMGASDSGAGFFMPWIMENIDPPTVVIERDVDDVRDSLDAIDLPMGEALDVLLDKLHAYKNHPRVLWVTFDSLNDKRIMQKIWFHLVPGVPFDDERYEQFNEFRIEADVAEVKRFALLNQERQSHMLAGAISLFKGNPSCLGSVQQ